MKFGNKINTRFKQDISKTFKKIFTAPRLIIQAELQLSIWWSHQKVIGKDLYGYSYIDIWLRT